jgi:hypothetical protein
MIVSSVVATVVLAVGAAMTGDLKSHCTKLTLSVDGRMEDRVAIGISIGKDLSPAQACPGGFLTPAAIVGDHVEVRVSGGGYDLDFGAISTRKFERMAAWNVTVDTAPFAPPLWWLKPPENVSEIRVIAFEPLEGDGTSISRFMTNQGGSTQARSDLRHLLLRINLVPEKAWLCLPAAGAWTLDSPVVVAVADHRTGGNEEECSRHNGFIKVMTTDQLREAAEDVLSEKTDATADVLLQALVTRYCQGCDRTGDHCPASAKR